jgi:hypothetical protein
MRESRRRVAALYEKGSTNATEFWKSGRLSKWSGRELGPKLLECAGPAYADRNLRELAIINRWFGGHRALLRVMRDLVHPKEHFSLLDVGAGSGDMARSLTRHFPT